jgi:TonB family protein
MSQSSFPAPRPVAVPSKPAAPRLLVELEPWHRSFLNNLRDALTRQETPRLSLVTRTAPFWDDVFVKPHFPHFWLLNSVLYHVALVGMLYAYSTIWLARPRAIIVQPRPETTPLTAYNLSDYLPPVTSASAPAKIERNGEPAYAKQEIVSAPMHPDNFSQTLVNPAEPKIVPQEVPLPNIVVWMPTPAAVPVAALERKDNKLVMPETTDVVPPSPQVARAKVATVKDLPDTNVDAPPPPPPNVARTKVAGVRDLPDPSVDAPPPELPSVARKLGDINMAATDIQVEKPVLPVPVQRATPKLVGDKNSNGENGGGTHANVVAPQITGNGTAPNPVGQFIALNVHPVLPNGPLEIPKGNRRGQFALSPTGTPNAPGTPTTHGGGNGNGGTATGTTGGVGNGDSNSLAETPGIYVAPGPVNPGNATVQAPKPTTPLTASNSTPTLHQLLAAAAKPLRPADVTNDPPAPVKDEVAASVFGAKRFYSMVLNMPNLTSAGGSWIMRFAELHQTGGPSDLTAPVAVHKVDPGYPADLMAEHIEGTVTLYAVIRADGSVDDVRVLQGVDERLDRFAQAALLRWTFRPATKNGMAVDLETVVRIPFVAKRRPY